MRNFTFGVEDSLVSTVGLLSGVAIANVDRRTIFLTGVVLIFVEAVSMAVGSLLAEQSAEEYELHKEVPLRHSLLGGGVMFFSYFFAGLIPLLPYLVFPTSLALTYSISASLLSLFLLGMVAAEISRVSFVKSGLRMLLLGGTAIAVGILAGQLTTSFVR